MLASSGERRSLCNLSLVFGQTIPFFAIPRVPPHGHGKAFFFTMPKGIFNIALFSPGHISSWCRLKVNGNEVIVFPLRQQQPRNTVAAT